MEAEVARRKLRQGSITLELLIAFSVFSLLGTAILLASGASATAAVDIQEETDMQEIAEDILSDAFAVSRTDFTKLIPSEGVSIIDATSYEWQQRVKDISRCIKEVVIHVSRTERRSQLPVSSRFASPLELEALGRDCEMVPPESSWQAMHVDSSDTSAGVKGTAIDVLGGLAYLGLDQFPYIAIADVLDVPTGTTEGLIHMPEESLALAAYPNALDAVSIGEGEDTHRYLFMALHSPDHQFAIVDASYIDHPKLLASTTPAQVEATGSFPQGWRLFYYDRKIYFVTRETEGPEFHIFDVSDPEFPHELGFGTFINSTIHDLVVRDEKVGDETRRFAYVATARDSGEVAVYDVTDTSETGSITEITGSRVDLPGNQNAQSIALLGHLLYVGRASNTAGPELYIFDASKPETGLILLGTGEVGTNVTGIQVAGPIAYLAATPSAVSTRRVEAWDISDPTHPMRLLQFGVSGLAQRGIDYESDTLYGVGEASPLFNIFKSI
ncbi:MAG: hypothetical protein WAV21_01405 [Minisyncoccia bacterium]